MTTMHTERGAVLVAGDLPAARLGDLRALIADFFARPGSAGAEVLVVELSGVRECAPELRDELVRALLAGAAHDTAVRIVPSEAVRSALGG